MTSAPKVGKQWAKTVLLGVRQHAEALKGQMKRNTSMRLRSGCGENKKLHYHHCHPVSSALAAVRTATQESTFTATVDSAKIRQVDNGAHQHRLLETTLSLINRCIRKEVKARRLVRNEQVLKVKNRFDRRWLAYSKCYLHWYDIG